MTKAERYKSYIKCKKEIAEIKKKNR